MKPVRFGILNTSTTSKTTSMETRSDHTPVTIRDNKLPCMIKLLTSACLVQIVLLVVTAATLGHYVNENVSLSFKSFWPILPAAYYFLSFYVEDYSKSKLGVRSFIALLTGKQYNENQNPAHKTNIRKILVSNIHILY